MDTMKAYLQGGSDDLVTPLGVETFGPIIFLNPALRLVLVSDHTSGSCQKSSAQRAPTLTRLSFASGGNMRSRPTGSWS
jgi:hypothetical protein